MYSYSNLQHIVTFVFELNGLFWMYFAMQGVVRTLMDKTDIHLPTYPAHYTLSMPTLHPIIHPLPPIP